MQKRSGSEHDLPIAITPYTMSESDPATNKTHPDDTRPSITEPAQVAASPTPPSDRTELLSRARTFLSAPEIRSQDPDAKRAFLGEKGLTSGEIDLLLRELVGPFLGGGVRSLTLSECIAPTGSTADVSRSPALRPTKPTHRCSKGAHMANRKFCNHPFDLLRAYPLRPRMDTI